VRPISTTTTDENRELVEEYFTAWTDQSGTEFPDILAEDFAGRIAEPTGDETEVSAERLRDMWAGNVETREDPRVEIHAVVADEDRVMSHVTYSYTTSKRNTASHPLAIASRSRSTSRFTSETARSSVLPNRYESRS